MSPQWLKNDWSLAHFLYYMARISAWLCILLIITQVVTTVTLLNSDDRYMALQQFSVTFSADGFSESSEFETNSVKGHIGDRLNGTANLMLKKSSIEPASYLLILFDLFDYALLAFGLFLLARLLKTVTEGEPFRPANVRRLYILGAMVILMPAYSALKQWAVISLIESSSLQGFEFYFYHTHSNFILFGILLIVLGYVFKEGARIYREQQLTV